MSPTKLSFLLSCLFALAFSQNVIATNHPRQGQPSGSALISTAPLLTISNTTPPSSTSTPSSTPSASQPAQPTPSSSSTTPTSTSQSNTAQSSSSTPPSSTQQSPPSSSSSSSIPSAVNTDSGTVTITQPNSASSSSSSGTPIPSTSHTDTSSSIGIGPIIGMSVAGGIAVIAIIAFFIWKFSRKRFSDFDDNEAIKWPELNTHGGTGVDSHPLPLHNTGRSGFDTGSEASLSRAPSTSNYSTPDVGGVSHDPYAVPPLPHLNPTQPYRDDPTGHTGYYDPYRGPVPNTLEHGADWTGEAIPMTQMAAANAGRMSPAQVPYAAGRVSPGPQMAYGGRASPGPHNAYAPGPQVGYGR